MGLFRNRKPALQPLITEADFDEVANYESALSYLIGLSGDDYTKVTQVAAIHRQAYYEAAKVLGIPDEPTTFINPPEPAPEAEDEPEFIDLDSKPGKKIKVNQ